MSWNISEFIHKYNTYVHVPSIRVKKAFFWGGYMYDMHNSLVIKMGDEHFIDQHTEYLGNDIFM